MCQYGRRKNTALLFRVSSWVDLWRGKAQWLLKEKFGITKQRPRRFPLTFHVCALWLSGSNLTCTFACNKDRGRNFTESKKLHWELLLLIICVCTNAPTLCVLLSQITALWKGEKTKCSTVNIKLNNGTVEPMCASSRELCAFLCSCCLMYQQSSGQHLLIISVNAFLRLLYVCFNVNVNEGYIEKRWKVELPWWEETDSLNLKIPSFKWLRLYIMLE